MKITRRQLRRLIQEAMSKEEIIGKLDKLSDSGEEGMIQAASLADALPDPETLDLDSSYEYRRQLINKLVSKRKNLLDELESSRSPEPTYDEEEHRLAQYYRDSDYAWGPQGYPEEHHYREARKTIIQRADIPQIEDEIAKLDAQIQTMVDDLGMDPATAHISSLS